jgi:hypothetical protein
MSADLHIRRIAKKGMVVLTQGLFFYTIPGFFIEYLTPDIPKEFWRLLCGLVPRSIWEEY